ncbi:MAG: hypothetical protein FWE47_00145, partial [Oscillospiraceae bacterium]|nr:hypothetical protein [Oscillospiraceae bacterium]
MLKREDERVIAVYNIDRHGYVKAFEFHKVDLMRDKLGYYEPKRVLGKPAPHEDTPWPMKGYVTNYGRLIDTPMRIDYYAEKNWLKNNWWYSIKFKNNYGEEYD